MAGFFQDNLNSQNYSNPVNLPPVNHVTPATASTIPAIGTVSASLNSGVTSTLIGGAASQAAAAFPSVTATGTGVITDATGTLNAGIGILGKTPQQLEAAGILKPGAAALVTGLVQRGMNVESAMTNNLFTGMSGAENLKSFINNKAAQSAAQIINFQQAQTAMTMTGAITGKEAPGVISGIINAATQAGVKSTVEFLQQSANATTISAATANLSTIPTFKTTNLQRTVSGMVTGIGGAA